MSDPTKIDGVLLTWGDRLFYPGNRVVREPSQPRLSALDARQRVAAMRERIAATVIRRAPQVMVKVTGGGRGMRAIAAHFRYISKYGRLQLEDELGRKVTGKESLWEMGDDWRYGGTQIPDVGNRRESFNIMLSMPRGTDPLAVQRAARDFATAELSDHKYVMVLHDHQANPHVHLSVRGESRRGKRLHPCKADLHRWRETFAEKLREWGIDAEATRQATRGVTRNYSPLWRQKARGDGRERHPRPENKGGTRADASRAEARAAWLRIADALATSTVESDRKLAAGIARLACEGHSPERANADGRGTNPSSSLGVLRSDRAGHRVEPGRDR